MQPTQDDAVIVPLSKTKMMFVLIGALGFVVLSIWIWIHAKEFVTLSLLGARVIAVVGMVFFAICALYAAAKLSDSSPGLIVDREGIIDNSSAVAAGRIPWSDITAIRVSTIASQRILTFDLLEPDKYDAGNWFWRTISSANAKLMGSPINITSTALKIDFDRLAALVNDAFAKYGTSR